MTDELKKLRDNITSIDVEILSKLNRRFKIAKEIKEKKNRMGLETEDTERENKLLQEWLERKGNLDEKFIEELFKLIVKESKTIQNNQ